MYGADNWDGRFHLPRRGPMVALIQMVDRRRRMVVVQIPIDVVREVDSLGIHHG